MISALKTTLCHLNLKILRPKVMKNIKNLSKMFHEFRPRILVTLQQVIMISINVENITLFGQELRNNYPEGLGRRYIISQVRFTSNLSIEKSSTESILKYFIWNCLVSQAHFYLFQRNGCLFRTFCQSTFKNFGHLLLNNILSCTHPHGFQHDMV